MSETKRYRFESREEFFKILFPSSELDEHDTMYKLRKNINTILYVNESHGNYTVDLLFKDSSNTINEALNKYLI